MGAQFTDVTIRIFEHGGGQNGEDLIRRIDLVVASHTTRDPWEGESPAPAAEDA